MKISTKPFRTIAVVAAMCFLLTACVAPSVKQRVIMPAKVPELGSAKKISVIGIENDNGEFTAMLEGYLSRIRVENQQYFTLVDRTLLQTVLQEQQLLNESGYFNSDDALDMGRLSGVDMIISGVLSASTPRPTNDKQERTRCDAKDSNGNCTKEVTYHINCLIRSMNVQYILKAISVQTGEIVYINPYNGKGTDTYCPDNKDNKDYAYLKNVAVEQIFNRMRQDIAPYEKQVTLRLMDEDESGMETEAPQAFAIFERGLEFAKANQMDIACAEFDKAASVFNASEAVYYNLGICKEMQGDYSGALNQFMQAQTFTVKPNRLITSAINRAKDMQINNQELSDQLN